MPKISRWRSAIVRHAAILLIVILTACKVDAPPETDPSPDAKGDAEWLEKERAPFEDGRPLVVQSNTVIESGELVNPVSASFDAHGNAIVADNTSNSVLQVHLGSGKLSRIELLTEPGKPVQWPFIVHVEGERLHLLDHVGLRTFTNRQQSAFVQPFVSMHDFHWISRDRIIMSADYVNPVGDEPLLLVVEKNGHILDRYGRSAPKSDVARMLNRAAVGASDGAFVAGFINQPVIAIFDRETHSRIDIRVKSGAFPGMQRLDSSRTFTHGTPGLLRLSEYLAGIAVRQEHIFAMLSLPYVCIKEYTLTGALLGTWVYRPPKPIKRLVGFDMAATGPRTFLVIGEDVNGLRSIQTFIAEE